MPKLVTVEGRVFSVPDDATPDEIDAIANPGRVPSGKVVGSFADTHPYVNAALDYGKGLLKGAGSTVNNVLNMAGDAGIPGFGAAPAVRQIVGTPTALTPKTTAQKAGYLTEQLGEWLIPTGAEAKAGTWAAEHAPQIAERLPGVVAKVASNPKVARFVGGMAGSAVDTAIRNKTQGGDLSTGAALGAVSPVIGAVGKKAASGLANIAVAPGKRLLKSIPEGVNIGETILNNSTGVKPKVVVGQLDSAITGQNNVLEGSITRADAAGKTDSIVPARSVVAAEMENALKQNAPDYIKDVGKVRDQLRYQYGPNGEPVMQRTAAVRQVPTAEIGGDGNFVMRAVSEPGAAVPVTLPENVTASRLRALKQGVDTTIGSWNPESAKAGTALKKQVYGAINAPYHAMIGPEGVAADQALTSLIAAREAAWNTSFNPSVTRNVFNRIGRPTGALAGGIAGGYEGYKRGGAGGAAAGGVIGLAVPELITSPAAQMFAARSLTNPVVGRFSKGAGLQFIRPKLAADEEQPTE